MHLLSQTFPFLISTHRGLNRRKASHRYQAVFFSLGNDHLGFVSHHGSETRESLSSCHFCLDLRAHAVLRKVNETQHGRDRTIHSSFPCLPGQPHSVSLTVLLTVPRCVPRWSPRVGTSMNVLRFCCSSLFHWLPLLLTLLGIK